MNRPIFEVRRSDVAGRIGRLEIPRAGITVETPAMLPVVNPHVQSIPPSRLAETFGAELLITNSYVLHGSDEYREQALSEGLHDLLDFPGAIMTDSGSFQLAEYGSIDVDTTEILEFQDAIGSDIATPVDIPTHPDRSRSEAASDLEQTNTAIQEAAEYDAGDMLITAPIQGATFPELREQAATAAYASNLDIFPIGAVVPLLRRYRYDDVVDAVVAAKRGLGTDAPVHLFGAGHPMMFALGVALGCDLFDSAAYALYAREDRYLTDMGTEQLEHLRYFPCSCPVCTSHTPADLRDMESDQRHQRLAEHNLYVTFGELRRVKQAVRRGELLELVETRARTHPKLLDGYRAALSHESHLCDADGVTGKRPFFYVSHESAIRPEVSRHHARLERLTVPEPLTLIDSALLSKATDTANRSASWPPDPLDEAPASLIEMIEGTPWLVIPPFGPVPPALEQTYPLTAERPQRRDRSALRSAIRGIDQLSVESPNLTLIHDGWPASILSDLDTATSIICHDKEEATSEYQPDSDQ